MPQGDQELTAEVAALGLNAALPGQLTVASRRIDEFGRGERG
jgi:hypothetical protein